MVQQVTRSKIPAHITVVRNTDRQVRCHSCKATADGILISERTLTRIWDEANQEVTQRRVSTCTRHLRTNLRRAAAMPDSVRVLDESGRWIER